MDLRTLNPRALNEQTLVSVAVDRSKGSQHAFRWAADNLLMKGQNVTLIHVNQNQSSCDVTSPSGSNYLSDGQESNDQLSQDLFLPFRVYARCKEVTCDPVTIDDNDIAKALIEYVSLYRVETLVIGLSSRNGISRTKFGRLFNKINDVPTTILKSAPDFCNVFIISKGKINATRPAARPLRSMSVVGRAPPFHEQLNLKTDEINFMSPFSRINTTMNRMPDEISMGENDFSFTSTSRQSTDSMLQNTGSEQQQRLRRNSMCNMSIDTQNLDNFLQRSGSKLTDKQLTPSPNSSVKSTTPKPEKPSKNADKIVAMEEKMRQLELQVNQTMEMYHAACKEALKDKQMVKELQLQRIEDEKKLAEAIREKEEALAIVEKEREICRTKIKTAKTAQKKAEKEAQKGKIIEAEKTKMKSNSLDNTPDFHGGTINKNDDF